MRRQYLFRGSDMNNDLPRMNNTLYNGYTGEVVVDDDWSKGAPLILWKGGSFTISSQTLKDLGGCYVKTAQPYDETNYTLDDRMGKKSMLATTGVNERNVIPDVSERVNVVEQSMGKHH